MLTQFFLDWRFTMLRAFAALAFGVLTLVWPGLTLLVLVTLFGAVRARRRRVHARRRGTG